MRLIVLIPLICLAVPTAGSASETAPSPGFGTIWFIEPAQVSDPSEPLRAGQPIFEAKLFPYKLFVLDKALSIEAGQTIEAGTQLVGLAGKSNIGCTKKAFAHSGANALLLKRKTIHSCFVDSDGDGRFDASFPVKSSATAFIRIEGSVPNDTRPVDPIAYREVDPKTITDAPNFYLFYAMHHAWVKKFSIGFLTKNSFTPSATEGYPIYQLNNKQLPMSIDLFGGKFRFEEIIEGRLRVKVEQSPKKIALYVGTRQN